MFSEIATKEFSMLLFIIDFNPVIQINDIGLAAWFGCPDCITTHCITTHHCLGQSALAVSTGGLMSPGQSRSWTIFSGRRGARQKAIIR